MEERLIPELRFPEFEGEWEKKKLGDVSSVGSSTRIYADEYRDNGIPFYRSTEIVDRDMNGKILYISEQKYNEISKNYNVPQSGEILVTAVGTLGTFHLIKEDDLPFYFKDGNLIWIRDIDNSVDRKYLIILLNTEFVERQIFKMVGGSSQKALTIIIVKNMKINLPSLPEQEKIGDFFYKIDRKLELKEERIEALKEHKKGMVQKIFNREIRFKDEDGRDYPEWEEKRLDSLGQFYNGLSGKNKDSFINGNKKYIQYLNIFKYTVIDDNFEDYGYVSIKEDRKQNIVQYGDVLFTQSSETPEEIGMTSVFLSNEEVYLNSFSFGFRFANKEETNFKYIAYLFRSDNLRKMIIREGQGSTRFNLSSNRLKNMSISFPSYEEQTKIANFLSALDRRIELEEEKLKNMRKFKKGLMQKMFI